MNIQQRIKDLSSKISEANKSYHNGSSTISDTIWDAWKDELSSIDPNNKLLKEVGAEPVSHEWEKHTHTVVLGSLNKVNTPEEFEKWAKDYVPNNDFSVSTKLDGLSVYLEYKDGQLVLACSRGNGNIGEKITKNVIKMIGVPKTLSKPLSIGVRGEIVMSKKTFEEHFLSEGYSNPRNCASGTSRRFDSIGCEYLELFTYKIYNHDMKTEEEQFTLLQSLGFKTPEHHTFKSAAECVVFKEEFQNSARDAGEYEADGLVFINNSIAMQEEFGYNNTGKNQRAAIAYKFANQGAETVIKDIFWQSGDGGRQTPVAEFEPVVIEGAEIRKATLYNYSYIKELGLDIGANVIVERGGGVIPLVSAVIKGTGTIAKLPTKCNACNGPVEMVGENLMCISSDTCSSQIIGRLKNWVKDLNILEWGDTLLTRLVETEKVSTIVDLYKLTEKDLSSLERMGERSAKKCLTLLWEANPIAYETFFGSLSIPGIGSSTIKLLTDVGIDNVDKIMGASQQVFESVKGFGPIRAAALYNGLRNNKDIISGLFAAGLKIKVKTMSKLNNKSFVITGATKIKRNDLKKMITDNGGIFKSTMGNSVNYLVCAKEDSTSVKAKKAVELGTEIISEEQLLAMME